MQMSEPDKIQRTDNGKEEKPAGELVTVTLHLGDCLEVMRSMPDNSVDAIVTDPPYELGFMGKSWDNTGIAYQIDLWQEVLRVLKPGGHLLSFGGTRTYHRMACAIEDAGFEIRDQIQWIYGSGFPKSLDISKAIDKMAGATGEVIGKELVDIGMQSGNMHAGRKSITIERDITAPATPDAVKWEGWGTALKPANEPIVLARKQLIGTVAKNVLEWGTGGLNIDGCRVGTGEKLIHGGSLVTNSGDTRTGKALGMFKAGTPNTFEQHPQGRFPANVIHDGSDEVVAMFPNETQRFFYCAKASRSERNAGLEGMEATQAPNPNYGKGGFKRPTDEPGREISPSQNHHPTVKPIALMRYLCKLITPPNGTVLDPFVGSGTTGCAAVQEGFNFIGIEREREYYEIAEKRIADAQQQMRLPI